MTAYERRRRAGRRRHEKRIAKKSRNKKKLFLKRAGIVFLVLVLLLGGTAAAYFWSKWNKVDTEKLNAQDLSINREIEHETGFVNVALFGLDSRDDDKGVGNRSDTIMVASLNKETGVIKLVSVYRDTLLELGDGSYNKANAAYSFGDAEAAVSLVNRNLDLDVKKYISCTFKALVLAIDAVGGITVNVKEEELNYLNGYQVEIIKATGIDSEAVTKPGKRHLNGTQATAYARIRYTEGGDFTRTERQREVLTKLGRKLKKCDVKKLNKIANKVFPEVKTNFTLKELLGYVPKVSHYAIGDTMGFPGKTSFTNLEGIGSCVIAEEFAKDVTDVHKFLFGKDTKYTASDVIKAIAAKILEYKSKGTESNGYDNTYDDTYTNTTGNQQLYNNNTENTYNNNNTYTNPNTDNSYNTPTTEEGTGTDQGTGTDTTPADGSGTGTDTGGADSGGTGGGGDVAPQAPQGASDQAAPQ